MSDRDPFEDDDPFEDMADAKTQASASAEQDLPPLRRAAQLLDRARRAEAEGRKAQAELLRAQARELVEPTAAPGGNGKEPAAATDDDWDEIAKGAPKGTRNVSLTRLAGRWIRKGATLEETVNELLGANANAKPPLPEVEVRSIAESVLATHRRKHPEAVQGASPAPTRDLGHALVLAELFRDRYRWAEHRGTWMQWTDQVWRPISENRMVSISTDELRRHYAELIKQTVGDKDEIRRLAALVNETCIYARMIGALSFLCGMDGYYTEAAQWDADGWTLNVKNGELDLRTGELRPHDSRHLHTMIAGVDYVPGAELAAWTAHLERFLPNANVRRQVQRDLGVALVGGTLQERLPIWYGTGGNGKTTTERIVQRVCGDYARTAAPNLLIASKWERHSTEIADLASSRIVFSVEIGSDKRLDLPQVKMLTGGDVKKARFMRQDFFEFEQTFSVFMLVNHRPRVSDNDPGTWRRLTLIPWEQEISEAERREQDEVVDELTGPAVLAWTVAGLHDFLAERAWVAPEVNEATGEYRRTEDRFSGFLADRCDLGHGYWTATSDLREAYETWCRDNDEEPAGQRAFLNALSEAGCRPKQSASGGARGWRGIRAKSAFKRPENANLTLPDTTSGSPNEKTLVQPIIAGPSGSVRTADEEDDLGLF